MISQTVLDYFLFCLRQPIIYVHIVNIRCHRKRKQCKVLKVACAGWCYCIFLLSINPIKRLTATMFVHLSHYIDCLWLSAASPVVPSKDLNLLHESSSQMCCSLKRVWKKVKGGVKSCNRVKGKGPKHRLSAQFNGI